MSCENLEFENLSDLDYIKHGFNLYLNNEPLQAIEFLEKRNSLNIDFAACLLRAFNSFITLDKNKIAQASILLRDLEKKCGTEPPSWISSIKSLFQGSRSLVIHRKLVIEEIEREIIHGDVLLCLSVLSILEFDVSSYIKAALTLRRAHKIYYQTLRRIQELCSQYVEENCGLELCKEF